MPTNKETLSAKRKAHSVISLPTPPAFFKGGMGEKVFDWVIKGPLFLIVLFVPLFFHLHLTTYTRPKVVIAQVLVSILLASWFLKMVLGGRFSFQRSMLSYPIFIYFLISISSLNFALSVPGGMSLLWQFFAYVAIYFIVIHHIPEEKVETWVLVIGLVGIVLSGYGILQYFGIEPLLQGYFYIPYIPYSTLGHRNQVAQYLVLVIPLSGTYSFVSPSRIRRIIFGLATLPMIYVLFLTKSRGGILGFILALFFLAGALIYKWLAKHPVRYTKKKLIIATAFVSPLVVILCFLLFPPSLRLKVKHVNPIGYYIYSVDGSKIRANQPIRIEFDYRFMKEPTGKPGYVNLYGGRTNSDPLYLQETVRGWNHVKREDISFSSIPDEDLKLRWVPGSNDSTLRLRNIVVQTGDGLNLIKDSFINRLFSKLGVTEIDKAMSGQTRLYLYRNTLGMIKDNLLFGAGFGNFKYVYPRYRDREEWTLSGLNTRVEEAHNEYLQIFSEVGIIGLLAFFWILINIGRMSLWMVRKGSLNRYFFVTLALTMGILATLVQSLFDFNLQNPASGVMFWMVVGFLEVMIHSVKRKKGRESSGLIVLSIRSKMLKGFIGFCILISLFAGIFYSVRPALGDYYLKWGRTYLQFKDWEGAFYCFERAKFFSPYNFDVYFHLGQAMDHLKDYEKAVDAYKSSIALHPYFLEAKNNLGALYIKLGRIDEAIEVFKEANEINPYHPGLHNNLGYLYSKRNLLKEAAEEYHKVLELDPENAEVYKNLGLLYFYKLKDYSKAEKFWGKYLILNPGDPQNNLIRNRIEEIKKKAN